MAWSTREIADLAGTSLRSVRHYHDVGLLPEPERRSNGYKQYGVAHLMRLLRIKRLVELGFSLPQIAELGERDEHPKEALRAADADLAAQIERLQALRAELAAILEQGVPTDLPAEFAGASWASMTAADRSMSMVMGRLLGEDERSTYAELLSDELRSQAYDDFDDLAPDADEAVREDLAMRMAAELARLVERIPDLRNLGTSVGPQRYRRTLDQVVHEIYNPAQVDVLHRLRALSRRPGPGQR